MTGSKTTSNFNRHLRNIHREITREMKYKDQNLNAIQFRKEDTIVKTHYIKKTKLYKCPYCDFSKYDERKQRINEYYIHT